MGQASKIILISCYGLKRKGVNMFIKIVSENMTDWKTGKLKFEVGKITMAPDFNSEKKCGGGIHYAEGLVTVLENTEYNSKGCLIEVIPEGRIIKFHNKYKAEGVIVKRIITIPEWLETISETDPDRRNRLLRAAKFGLETISETDPDEWNRLLRAAKTGDWNCVFEESVFRNTKGMENGV